MKANVAADDPRAVLRVFRQMRSDDVDRDLVTYNTLIFGLARARMVAKARAFLDDMAAEGHLPNVVTYTSLMNRMCVKGDALGALKLLEEMQGKGSILGWFFILFFSLFCQHRVAFTY
jgi:pentatricopeptide repeat protein